LQRSPLLDPLGGSETRRYRTIVIRVSHFVRRKVPRDLWPEDTERKREKETASVSLGTPGFPGTTPSCDSALDARMPRVRERGAAACRTVPREKSISGGGGGGIRTHPRSRSCARGASRSGNPLARKSPHRWGLQIATKRRSDWLGSHLENTLRRQRRLHVTRARGNGEAGRSR